MPTEDFKILVKNSNSYLDILKNFYINPTSGNYKTLKKRIEEENIDIVHIELNKTKSKCKPEIIPLELILVKNSTYTSRNTLKKRLLKDGLLDNKCYECSLGPEWNGKHLSLQLEHKNGIANDNRIENLSLLCPNCHSQTDTYAGKNANKHKQILCNDCGIKISKHSKTNLCVKCVKIKQRKVERPDRDTLKNLIKEKPFVLIAKEYNVTDNAIKKWCKQYDLPHIKSEIKNYTEEEWKNI